VDDQPTLLEVVSISLAATNIAMILGGILAYVSFRDIAKKRATDAATNTARRVAREEFKKVTKKLLKRFREDVRRDAGDEIAAIEAGHREFEEGQDINTESGEKR